MPPDHSPDSDEIVVSRPTKKRKQLTEEEAAKVGEELKALQSSYYTRQDLERIFCQQMSVQLKLQSELAKAHLRMNDLERHVEHYKRRASLMQQWVNNLTVVKRRYAMHMKNRRDHFVPVKITRSVGLQARMDVVMVYDGQNKFVPAPVGTKAPMAGVPQKLVPATPPVVQPNTTITGVGPSGVAVKKGSNPVQTVLLKGIMPFAQEGSLPQAHPAPLPQIKPSCFRMAGWKDLPPKLELRVSLEDNGIGLAWDIPGVHNHAEISTYQVFAYQESHMPPNPSLWEKIKDAKALPLPMAFKLAKFQGGRKYHFAVRAIDVHSRFGPFSDPLSIMLRQSLP